MPSKYSELSVKEREALLKMLKQLGTEGQSEIYNDLKYSDYKEIPVDIETFITDKKYLGNTWVDAKGNLKLYPYWLKVLKQLFPDNTSTSVNTLLESGARGLGKSEVAVIVALYILYRAICLKDPVSFFHLKSNDHVFIAFMNITQAAAEKIAISKFAETALASPWFMAHGERTSYNSKPFWRPPLPFEIVIGSQSSDVIGIALLYCLDGDTEIVTEQGVYKLKDLENKSIRVYSISDSGDLVLSDTCTVKATSNSNVYYEIETEDGYKIRCTPNHKLMLKDGSYKEACELTLSDELFDVKPFGYIYKFTNTVTNKIYIGKREKSKFDNSYWGSGKLWKKDLELYGKEVITREVLCWALTRDELNSLEKYYIDKYNSRDRALGYNISKGGQGGNSLGDTEAWSKLHLGSRNGRYHKEVSQQTREKISKANKGRNVGIKCPSRGRPGVKKPPGFGEKLSRYMKEHRRLGGDNPSSVSVVCINTNEVFASMVEGRLKYPNCRHISECCRGIIKTTGGLSWRYYDEN